MSETDLNNVNSEKSEKKPIGFVTVFSLMVGLVVGAGILILPSAVAQYGKWGFWAWPICSFMALNLAFMFSFLSKKDSKASGPASFVAKYFGDLSGFQTAWAHWFALCMGGALIAISLAEYTAEAFNITKMYCLYIALVSLWGIVILKSLYTLVSLTSMIVITFIKLLTLGAIIAAGMMNVSSDVVTAVPIAPEYGGFTGLISAVAFVLFTFVGIEGATLPGENVKNPSKNIPIATILGTLLAAGLFTLTYAVVYSTVPTEQLIVSNTPVSDAAKILFGKIGETFISVFAVVGCFGSLAGTIFATAHILRSSADLKWLPAGFSKMTTACFPIMGGVLSALVSSIGVIVYYYSPITVQYLVRNSLAGLEVFLVSIVYLFCSMAYKVAGGRFSIWAISTLSCIVFLLGSIGDYTNMAISLSAYFLSGVIYSIYKVKK